MEKTALASHKGAVELVVNKTHQVHFLSAPARLDSALSDILLFKVNWA